MGWNVRSFIKLFVGEKKELLKPQEFMISAWNFLLLLFLIRHIFRSLHSVRVSCTYKARNEFFLRNRVFPFNYVIFWH